jgi:hypothetical protein
VLVLQQGDRERDGDNIREKGRKIPELLLQKMREGDAEAQEKAKESQMDKMISIIFYNIIYKLATRV